MSGKGKGTTVTTTTTTPAKAKYTDAEKAEYYKSELTKLKRSKKKEPPKPKTKANYRTRLNGAQIMNPYKYTDYPPPSSLSLGNFVCIPSTTKGSFVLPANETVVVLFAPSVRGIIQSKIWSSTSGGDYYAAFPDSNSPTHKFKDSNVKAYRPLRAGCRIRNLNSATTREGSCIVLNSSNPTSLIFNGASTALTPASAASIADSIKNSSKSRLYTAEELSQGENTFVNFPCVQSSYHSYGDDGFNSTEDITNVQLAFHNAETDMAMSNMLLLITSGANAQTYSISLSVQSALRFSENTILGNMEKHGTGTAAPSEVQSIHSDVTQNGANIVGPITFGSSSGASASMVR